MSTIEPTRPADVLGEDGLDARDLRCILRRHKREVIR